MNGVKDEVLNENDLELMEEILQNKRNLKRDEYKFIKRLYICYKKDIINMKNLKMILNI